MSADAGFLQTRLELQILEARILAGLYKVATVMDGAAWRRDPRDSEGPKKAHKQRLGRDIPYKPPDNEAQ